MTKHLRMDLPEPQKKLFQISLFSPTLSIEELDNIKHSFDMAWVGKGMKVEAFEYAWSEHIGVDPENIVSVNCATEGLFQVFELLKPAGGLVPLSQVIIPTIHFIGAAQAVISAGGMPIFCDVDRRTLNPTLEHIQAKYTRHTEAVCLLHYGGVAQELDAIREWCDQKGLWLIEDAACSPATVYKGKAAGTWGHFGVWSFDAMKVISTGDGGMIYCENTEHARELRHRLYLGLDQTSGLSSQNERWWEFSVSGMGRRAVMNDIAAGIGLEQLRKLDSFVGRRYEICTKYLLGFGDNTDIINCSEVYHFPIGDRLSHYFFWIQTPRRDDLAKFLRANDIYVSFRYWPLHRAFKTGDKLPIAEWAADNTLLLPLHCNLSDSDAEMVCGKVREFYGSH